MHSQTRPLSLLLSSRRRQLLPPPTFLLAPAPPTSDLRPTPPRRPALSSDTLPVEPLLSDRVRHLRYEKERNKELAANLKMEPVQML
ncbi:unnamed protein product [Lactuca virosa]|uniref:Uncharacterized protein n=1 Tax=Lactuca virosa TaxID=75947 RepID=A0AAU9M6S8_9ASTR|nr:unnamed protein product [Lactuca virosa]